MAEEKREPGTAAPTAVVAAPPPEREAEILSPVAPVERLLESFKEYQRLKDLLLDPSDYIHVVRFRVGERDKIKVFSLLTEADAFAKTMTDKKIPVQQERRIRKAGVQKLSKAFGVSDRVIERVATQTSVYYRVEASVRNQRKERAGVCDRNEQGRGDSTFDHMDATALTRATNRAIMALLGGEITAEETIESSEENGKQQRKAAKAEPKQKAEETRPEQKTETELKSDLNAAFDKTKAASDKAADPRRRLINAMFAAADAAGIPTDRLRDTVKGTYGKTSTKDLTDAQVIEITEALIDRAKQRKEAEKKQ